MHELDRVGTLGAVDRELVAGLHPAGEPTPPAVLAQCLTLGRREDLAVSIGGYGSGQLSVVLTYA